MSRSTITRHKAFRGQGAKLTGGCKGKLVIVLSGPHGVGKSLVVKLLKALLPITMVDTVVIIESQN